MLDVCAGRTEKRFSLCVAILSLLVACDCSQIVNPLDARSPAGLVDSMLLCQLFGPCGGNSRGGGGTLPFSDLNGDGYADVIVGAWQNQGGGAADKGAVYVFYGSSTGITSHPESGSSFACNGYPDCTVIQNPDNEATGQFGNSVAYAGDVNGDGYADIIVGAPKNQGGGAADKGVAYIFYGSANGIMSHPESGVAYSCNGPPDCTVVQNPDNEASAQFGFSVASASDVNRDGYSDVIIGAFGNQGAGSADKGVAYVFYGSANGITPHPESAAAYACTGPPDCTAFQDPLDGFATQFGIWVFGAGDVNGDGYADVIVGLPLTFGIGGASGKGAAYIFYGSAGGITSHPESALAYTCTGPPDCTVIENPDDEATGQFGLSATTAGDVNRDGFDDIVVSARSNQGAGANNKGAAYVFYGSASGIVSHPLSAATYSCSGPPDCTVVQNPDNEASGSFANGLSNAGDVNGDGYADIILGGYLNQGPGAADKGAAYIFYGSASGITSHPESAAAYACNGPPDCTAVQNPDNSATGIFGFAVAKAGDVNGDGIADIIVGAYKNQGPGVVQKGAAYVFYGSTSGITSHQESAANYSCSGPPDCTVVQNPDNESSGNFGRSVAWSGLRETEAMQCVAHRKDFVRSISNMCALRVAS